MKVSIRKPSSLGMKVATERKPSVTGPSRSRASGADMRNSWAWGVAPRAAFGLGTLSPAPSFLNAPVDGRHRHSCLTAG